MAQPYESSATELVTTDPQLLRRKAIDAALADRWREVILPKPLQPLTNTTAKTFGYELLPELDAELVWLSRTPAHSPPVIFLHDFTGVLWGFDALARVLRAPCLGIQCSKRLIEGCTSMQELAWRYVRLLPPSVRKPVRLVAYSLSCRIAYRMAVALEQMGESVQLVLLDGPVGPENDAPPRLDGMVATIVDQIQSRVRSQQNGTASLATPSTDSLELTADPINALVGMVASMGEGAASVTTALLQLPDPEDAPTPPVRVAALHIAAESSANRTNGTIETVKRCLPGLEQAAVPGAQFDFVEQSAEAIAEHANGFFERLGVAVEGCQPTSSYTE
jgi:pimeloyl-ACP methyl ester carboxylesterase